MTTTVKSLKNEDWKEVKFTGIKTQNRYYISSLGRVKTVINGNERILKASKASGYSIINISHFRAATSQEIDQTTLAYQKVLVEQRKIKALEKELKPHSRKSDEYKSKKEKIEALETKLTKLKKERAALAQQLIANRRTRLRIYVHGEVARKFLPKPATKDHKIVIHLDHNKENNAAKNLRWATTAEAAKNAQKSPLVIAARKNQVKRVTNSKLTEKQVADIKSMLASGKTLKQIGGKYQISDMQVYRIKTGQNWSDVKAKSKIK